MPDLGDFEGTWDLARVIEDARAGQTGRLAGQAVFSLGDDGLTYDESGTLEIPGQAPMTAHRRYLWRNGAAGIEVAFSDGRFFHAIGPGDRPEARHDCPPDLYRVAYDFSAWPGWTSTWRVTGPRKDYVMRSVYAPLGTCAPHGAGAEGTSTV